MDISVNRNIHSFTDMNDQGSARTYEVGDTEERHSESVEIISISLQLYGATAAFAIYYDDGLCKMVITSNFSAITYLEKYNPEEDL